MNIMLQKYRNKSVLVASYSCNNVSDIIRDCQKLVFNKFGWEINQVVDNIDHWHALDMIVSNMSDIYFIFDVDCVPLKYGAIEEVISRVIKNETIVGIEQTCNCNESIGHIYVAPACICFSNKTYEKLGKPSFLMNQRSDVGQELTHRAEENGVNIEVIRFKSSKNHKWKLGSERMFGNGSNYSDLFYHQYEIRCTDQENDFIDHCNRIICSKNNYIQTNPNNIEHLSRHVQNDVAMTYIDNCDNTVKSSSLDCTRGNESTVDLPLHFFTIVLNGKPFIEKHISTFEKLLFPWHWHIIEGVAALKHDTAWSLANGGHIDDTLHNNGLSNDGTSEYLDVLARKYPDRVTIYRKNSGEFWDGKLEMVQAPLEYCQGGMFVVAGGRR